MKIQFIPDINILKIEFTTSAAQEERECAVGVVLELAENGELVSLKIEGAKTAINFASLQLVGWPDVSGLNLPSLEMGGEDKSDGLGGLIP